MQASSAEEKLAVFQDDGYSLPRSYTYTTGQKAANGQIQIATSLVPVDRLVASLAACDAPYQVEIVSLPRHSPPPNLRSTRRFFLGGTKELVLKVIEKRQLHHLTLEAMINNNGIFAEFKTGTRYHMIIKVPKSESMGHDFMSLSHDYLTKKTNVLYHGLNDEAGLLASLQHSAQRCENPRFFATMLFRFHQLSIERYREQVDASVLNAEAATDFGYPGALKNPAKIPAKHTEFLDYNSITQLLSCCQTELAMIDFVAKFNLELGTWLERRLARPCKLHKPDMDLSTGGTSTIDQNSCSFSKSAHEMQEEVAYSLSRASTTVPQVQSMIGRVHSQTTLIYSLISQNESKYTAAIALDSKRDSTAMKTIAVMTILFLPATFVASFFSMNMIDWMPSDDAKPQVSDYIWVYWVISIPLTLLVLITWLAWSRMSHNKSEMRVNAQARRFAKT